VIPKIVIDTNIYISAIFWGGKPREVVNLGRSGQIDIFTSFEIEDEIKKKLKGKFNLQEEETALILADFSSFTNLVKIGERIEVIDDDPDDNKFIECAISSLAGFIISGDRHLLDLKHFKEIKIITAAEFLSMVKGEAHGA
jgi:putative PIN family toxin of toxin-antitoxin system